MKQEYSHAAVEILDILDNTNDEDVQKIPASFIKFLVDIASTNYRVNFNHAKNIQELDLSDKAQEILGYIYINWWASLEEQKQYKEEIERNKRKREKALREKYNPDNMFKDKKAQNHFQMECYQEKQDKDFKIYKRNILNCIIDKFKKFFI